MATLSRQGFPRIEVRAHLTPDQHARMMAELNHCGCNVKGFVTVAIMREIARRKKERVEQANIDVLAGQLELEEANDASHD